MSVMVLGYVAIGLLWVTLLVLHHQQPAVWHKARRATWWLLAASIIVAIAWFVDELWLSFLGMLAALTSVSFVFQVMTDWLKRKHVSYGAKLIWFEWLFILSATLAHVLVGLLTFLKQYST